MVGVDLVSDRGTQPAEPTAEPPETARALRAVTSEELPISGDHADADWMVTQASERPARRDPQQPETEADQPQPDEQVKARPARRGKGRASVPSWDEIMFGSGGHD